MIVRLAPTNTDHYSYRIVGPYVACRQVCTECRTNGKSTLKVHPGPLNRNLREEEVHKGSMIAQHSNERLLQKCSFRNVRAMNNLRQKCEAPAFLGSVPAYCIKIMCLRMVKVNLE